MTTTEPSLGLDLWLDAFTAGTIELAETTLAWYAAPLDGHTTDLPVAGEGAYVPMFTEGADVQLGLVSSPWGAQALAKGLLGMESDDEDLGDEDMADAIGEIVNIVAGAVKSRLIEHEPSIRLGLPVYLAGYIRPSSAHQVAAREIAIGPVRATLLVLRHST